jgi:hypothetical protein
MADPYAGILPRKGICTCCGIGLIANWGLWLEDNERHQIHTGSACQQHLEAAFDLLLAIGRPPR